MRGSYQKWTAIALMALLAGCSWRPTEDKHQLADSTFGERHTGHYPADSVLAMASEVTEIEDEIRRNGSITVKAPDVWGDANLMSAIQEYETQMKGEIGKFNEVLSAYIARSDQAELQSATGIAMAASDGGSSDAAGSSSSQSQTTLLMPDVGEGKGANIANIPPSQLLKSFVEAAPPKASGVGVEPTELLRQHSTYIGVNQALRRRNMGDDRSRQAGYALYKFRVPVSVLPGRQTHQGYAAVVNMRARMEIDAAHLKYMFPKLVIADVVDGFTDPIYTAWDKKPTKSVSEKAKVIQDIEKTVVRFFVGGTIPSETTIENTCNTAFEKAKTAIKSGTDKADAMQSIVSSISALAKNRDKKFQEQFKDAIAKILCPIGISALTTDETDGTASLATNFSAVPNAESPLEFVQPPLGLTPSTFEDVNHAEAVAKIIAIAKKRFDNKPKRAELRQFLFDHLSQRYEVIRRLDQFCILAKTPDAKYMISAAADRIARGEDAKTIREQWIAEACKTNSQATVDWTLAVQAGILDYNIKKMFEELCLEGKVSSSDAELAKMVYFFEDPTCDQDDSVRLWAMMIEEAFPVHVFALDPEVEEQNAYGAFSRRREMQIALAISVARGGWNTAQKVDMSRQLALDMATIDLNRTAVAFSHDNDTFGWYFYPRIQAPPTEKSNIAAMARLVWSGGPTEHYDQKHLEIEPGMRECEVLIAMPSFVPRVEFDVTTNWERLTNPGATKQSYEEMVALGGRIHRLRCNLRGANDQQCFRPGDYQRLISRVDQLEKMLSLQTYEVGLPFEYEQSGTNLFDRGNVDQRPILYDYYGLQYVTTDKDEGGAAYMLIRGKNFHPTLTHVIVGGAKSDSYSPTTEPDVQVVSRELIRVKINRLYEKLSEDNKFVVRCGTPAGISNPLIIDAKAAKKPAPSTPDFELQNPEWLGGNALLNHPLNQVFLHFNQQPVPSRHIFVKYNKLYPLPLDVNYDVITEWEIKTGGKTEKIVSLPSAGAQYQGSNMIAVDLDTLRKEIFGAMESALPRSDDYTEAKGKMLIRIGDWPFMPVGGDLTIKVFHQPPPAATPPATPTKAADAATPTPTSPAPPEPVAAPQGVPTGSTPVAEGAFLPIRSETVPNRLRF